MIIISMLLIGLFFGSFLGVLVDRIPNNKQFLTGRSKCDKCKKELGVLDLIPVLSFIFSKGRCRHCDVKLSFFYPIIEITTGILFVVVYYLSISNEFFNLQSLIVSPLLLISFLYYYFIISILIVIFFIDLKYGIIPNSLNLVASIITFVYLIVSHRPLIFNHLLTGVFSLLFLLSVSAIFYFLTKKQSMGGGDIKFAFIMGLIIGFPNIIVAFYLAFLTGAIYSIILILWKKKSFRKDSIPFGPFLALATFISIFWGNFIWGNALKLLGI